MSKLKVSAIHDPDNDNEAITVDTSGNVTVSNNLDVSSGTIKLDGNYPDGTGNVALGNGTFNSASFTGTNNTAIGSDVLFNDTSGSQNTGIGYQALADNTTGERNTAVGFSSLKDTTSGTNNVAVGRSCMLLNTTGGANVSVGSDTLYNNTTGSSNIAVGRSALLSNTTASNNTAVGAESMQYNTTGVNNTAVGFRSLRDNTTGSDNTFVGDRSGTNNTTGYLNCFIGDQSGQANTTGHHNTYVGGGGCGYFMTTGSNNTILGSYNGNQGNLDIRTASNNIVLSDGDGNIGMYVNANQRVYMSSAANNGNLRLASKSSAGTTSAIIQGTHSATNIFGGTDCFFVWSNGNVVNTNNSYGAISDVKLKENIVDSGSQWDDIKAVRVRKYSMKADNLDAPNQLGVIAQELEESGMSGLVFESPDRDADENELGTTTKQVHYSVLYMKAVKALQEAMDRIETLEAKVTALESA